MQRLQQLVTQVERVEKALCASSAIAFTVLIVANVVLRYGFNTPLYFAEEASVILMVWMALLAASLTLGRREMVAVTLFTEFLPERFRAIVDLLVQVIVLLVALTFLYWSVVWMMSPAATRDVVITLGIKKWYPYLIVPVFFLLSSLKALNNVAVVAPRVFR